MKIAAALLLVFLICPPAWAEEAWYYNYTGAVSGITAPPDAMTGFSGASIAANPGPAAAAHDPKQLSPDESAEALAEGRYIASAAAIYNKGLGLFRPMGFEYVSERPARKKELREGSGLTVVEKKAAVGYILVGTKFNLVRARAAAAAHRKVAVPKDYVDRALAAERLPVAFYVHEFDPGLMLLVQDGVVIKGDDGWAGLDPGLGLGQMVKSFPYEAIDLSKPFRLVIYDLDGNTYNFDIDPGARE